MRSVPLAAALLTLSIAAGCASTQARPVRDFVPKGSAPADTSGYVGAIASPDTLIGFGFVLREQQTEREYVLSLENKGLSMIALPPSKYRVASWVTFAVTGEELDRQQIPEGDVLEPYFDLGGGEVVLLGRWSAERAVGFGGSTFRLVPLGIAAQAATAMLRESYPGFASAPVSCRACTP